MNHQDFPFSATWQFKPFFVFHAIALALLASWMLPGTQSLWRSIDEWVFFSLNGSLADSPNAQYFWAMLNIRLSDLIPFTIIITTLTFPVAGLKRHQLQQALLGFVLLMVLMFIFRKSLHVITVDLGLSGDSPSLQLQPAFYLSELIPELSAKDRAHRSFPGDHAAVLWAWAGYMMFMLRSKWALLTAVVCIFFTLPRMVGGAHWFSDNYVGGIVVALLTLSWAFHTPLLSRPTAALHRVLMPVFNFIGNNIPLLGKLPFFNR